MSKKPQGKSSKKKQNARSGAKVNAKSAETMGQPNVTGGARIVIIAFAVIMALSMMLPSLSAIFSPDSSAPEQQSQPSSSSSDDGEKDAGSSTDASSSASTSDAAATGVAAIDASYQTRVDPLEKKYGEDPKNLATLLNLGNAYMSWGVNVSYSGTDAATTAHAQDLFDQAVDYYNQYLALNETDAVKVDIALCELYRGDTESAQSELEALTKASPDYGPAWANLGMVYEVAGNTDGALDAYAKAIEADPNDEYGAKSYGEKRVASINSTASATTTGSAVGQGLSDTLKNHDGTNL